MDLRAGRRRREEATIELTPLIDVVFLLLIFFLLTSSISQARQSDSSESAIPIDLPSAQSGSTDISGDPLVLTVNDAGDIEVEGDKDLVGDTLEAKLLDLYRKDPEATILLRGDRKASHGRVIELLDLVKQIGFEGVDLVIETPRR